mgnify:CR=1 FL=1
MVLALGELDAAGRSSCLDLTSTALGSLFAALERLDFFLGGGELLRSRRGSVFAREGTGLVGGGAAGLAGGVGLELRLVVVLVDLGLLFEDEDDARLCGLEGALVALGDDCVVGRLGSACGKLETSLPISRWFTIERLSSKRNSTGSSTVMIFVSGVFASESIA